MRSLVPPITAVLLALVCVAPAQAEKWKWFQIRGGAVAYDADSRKTDVEADMVGADTLIFYDQARSVPEGEFNFIAERLEFECRGGRHRWKRSAVLDKEGRVVLTRPDSAWEPMPEPTSSTALFSHMLCKSEDPPGGKVSPDLTSAIAAMRAGGASVAALADLAFPAPKVVSPARPVTAAPAPKASPVPPSQVSAPPAADPIGAVLAAAPRSSPAPKLLDKVPAIATLPPAPARASGGTIPAPAGSTPYPVAERCLLMKKGQDPRFYYAFNDCSYRVNYAWCVTNSEFASAECGGPTLARGAGAVAARGTAQSTYPGGMGRLYTFACRAPGTPVVSEADGKLTHTCLGPAATTTTQPKAAQPLPALRRLTP